MYETLREFLERPEPFCAYTAEALWTDEHISALMLKAHLDPHTDKASRRPEAIDRIVRWVESRIGLAGQAICDLGCGPGLYTERMAMHGARVCGVDFCERALNHARWAAAAKRLKIIYIHANYLTGTLPCEQNIATLFHGGYCILSPAQRRDLLRRVHDMLKPGGHLVLDVQSRAEFGSIEEDFICERRLQNGFFGEDDYFGFKAVHRYPEQYLALERFLIVEPERQRSFFNWTQFFSPAQIESELKHAGFEVRVVFDLSSGGPWIDKATPFGVLARKR